MKCLSCGSDNCQFVSEVSSKGFSASKGCCGFLLFSGPIGLLCGLCGRGKTDTQTYWVCNNCGNRFQDNTKYYNNVQQDNTNIHQNTLREKDISNSILSAEFLLDKNKINLNYAFNSNITELNEKFSSKYLSLIQLIKYKLNKNLYTLFKDFMNNISLDLKSRLTLNMLSSQIDLLKTKKLIWNSVGKNKDFYKNNEEILFLIENSPEWDCSSAITVTTKNIHFNNGKSVKVTNSTIIELNHNNEIIINGGLIDTPCISIDDRTAIVVFLNLIYGKNIIPILSSSKNSLLPAEGYNNMINGSYISKHGEFTFFYKQTNHSVGRLSRIDASSKIISLTGEDEIISNIKIVNNFLYCKAEVVGNDAFIYKMNLDGSNKTILCNYVKEVLITNTGVLYRGKKSKCSFMDLDGSNNITFTEKFVKILNIQDNWIYYSNNDKLSGGIIYKIRPDGSDNTKMFDQDIKCDNMILIDNHFYFSDYNKLCRIKPDGSDLSTLITSTSSLFRFNIYKDWILYTDKDIASSKDCLKRMHLNGRNKEVLAFDCIDNITIIDNWVYYFTGVNTEKFFRPIDFGVNRKMYINGAEKQPL